MWEWVPGYIKCSTALPVPLLCCQIYLFNLSFVLRIRFGSHSARVTKVFKKWSGLKVYNLERYISKAFKIDLNSISFLLFMFLSFLFHVILRNFILHLCSKSHPSPKNHVILHDIYPCLNLYQHNLAASSWRATLKSIFSVTWVLYGTRHLKK